MMSLTSAVPDDVSVFSHGRATAIDWSPSDGQPIYGIDVVALAFAVVLAAVLALLLSHLVPQLVELIRYGAPNAARR